MPIKTSTPGVICITASELDPEGERRPVWEALGMLWGNPWEDGVPEELIEEQLRWEREITDLIEQDGGTCFLSRSSDGRGDMILRFKKETTRVFGIAPDWSKVP